MLFKNSKCRKEVILRVIPQAGQGMPDKFLNQHTDNPNPSDGKRKSIINPIIAGPRYLKYFAWAEKGN